MFSPDKHCAGAIAKKLYFKNLRTKLAPNQQGNMVLLVVNCLNISFIFLIVS